jgi:acyl-CoA reductase-like NAD-dependent aldehyde dehydrogenase
VYIDGKWVCSDSRERISVLNPATEERIGEVSAGHANDVDRAVEAANRAFQHWSNRPFEERMNYLMQLHGKLVGEKTLLTETITADVGCPIKIARRLQIDLPLAVLASFGDAAVWPVDKRLDNSLVVREPIGVVGAITPWNYPLHQVVAKVAPALLAGCTVVLKPSEITPLVVEMLAEAIDEVGFPGGVFNLVSGYGSTVGQRLARHPGVDMVSFTGSTRAGISVAVAAAETVKRTALELGGKGANIILPDVADLTRAVRSGVGNCYLNSGQTCLALTRMLVHRSQYDDAVDIAASVAKQFILGNPFDLATKLGPLTSSDHRARVWSYIDRGATEGARLVTGGSDRPDGLEIGYFAKPTVFADVPRQSTLAKEEIFGPVLAVMSFDDDDDAVSLANDTCYGLTAGVWSSNDDHALSIARRIRAGQVEINGGAFNHRAPFGGYRQSGNGRELGQFGLEEFFEVKAIQK